MSAQHHTLAEGKWQTFSFAEQMGNIGSEVARCIKQKNAHNSINQQYAFERALELFDLTIQDHRNIRRLRELTRLRETFVDFIAYDNQYRSTDSAWSNYFLAFVYAARHTPNKY